MNPSNFCALAAGILLGAALPAQAQYKVVAPDGSVTYTDRPPSSTTARVTALGREGQAAQAAAATAAVDAALPLELRLVMGRYPVTLFTTADCAPCDSGRALLQQRGVPFSEKKVSTEEDAAALERVVGGRTLPSLTIGSQALRGLSQADWSSYLDAAGYPRESRLPRGWQAPAPTAMVERVAAPRTAPAAAPATAAAAPEVAPPPITTPPGVRF